MLCIINVFMFSFNISTLLFHLNFILIILKFSFNTFNFIRRPCFGEGTLQGYWRRSRYRLRRAHPQGTINVSQQLLPRRNPKQQLQAAVVLSENQLNFLYVFIKYLFSFVNEAAMSCR